MGIFNSDVPSERVYAEDPVSPHAAGEEDTTKLRTEFTNTLGEYLNAWTGYKEHPCSECSQRVSIAHDRLWRMVSPAASQATPEREMPDHIQRTLEAKHALHRQFPNANKSIEDEMIFYLADRVAELEREAEFDEAEIRGLRERFL